LLEVFRYGSKQNIGADFTQESVAQDSHLRTVLMDGFNLLKV
jgi:hypothetical protein